MFLTVNNSLSSLPIFSHLVSIFRKFKKKKKKKKNRLSVVTVSTIIRITFFVLTIVITTFLIVVLVIALGHSHPRVVRLHSKLAFFLFLVLFVICSSLLCRHCTFGPILVRFLVLLSNERKRVLEDVAQVVHHLVLIKRRLVLKPQEKAFLGVALLPSFPWTLATLPCCAFTVLFRDVLSLSCVECRLETHEKQKSGGKKF